MTRHRVRPPKFPRIAHLPGSRGTDDDLRLADASEWFTQPVVVEEKLDGANVAVWIDADGRLRATGRGSQDRAGQLGRLRAWVAGHTLALRDLLRPTTGHGDLVLYGEWLWLTHTLHYDRLPDLLVVLDLWSPDTGFLDHCARDERVRAAGLTPVPVLFEGVLGDPSRLGALVTRSTWGGERMEGVVLRREHEGRLTDRAKWVRPDFTPRPDDTWTPPHRENTVRG